jgi:hypothetical protein
MPILFLVIKKKIGSKKKSHELYLGQGAVSSVRKQLYFMKAVL